MLQMLVLATLATASPWAGRYSLTSQLESTDCSSFQCPAGMAQVPAYVVEQGSLIRAWLYPHQGLQVAYDCSANASALLCTAHVPGEAYDVTSTVRMAIQEGGQLVGQATEVVSTCIDTEVTSCTCTYGLQAHKAAKAR